MRLTALVRVCSSFNNRSLLLRVYIEGLLVDFYTSFHDWEEHLKALDRESHITKYLQGVQDNFNCFIIRVHHCFPP